MPIQLQDLNRRNIPLQKSKVREVLPEYFIEDYPNFVTFLEKYYNFLDSDGTYSFDTQIHKLFSTRDIDQTPESVLDFIGRELGSGVSTVGSFERPRYAIRRFGEHFRTKGTPVSAETFFRLLFQVEPEIQYPKENLFTVGSSQIGYENGKVILDHARNQIFSILYKVPLGINVWSELYKTFVHPAGYYFSADVLIEGEVDLSLRTMPTVFLDSAVGPTLIDEASQVPGISFEQFTTLQADVETGIIHRASQEETVDKYADLQLDSLDTMFDNLAQMFTPNSFKFDDSAASVDSAAPDFSMTFETFDQEMYDSYGKAY